MVPIITRAEIYGNEASQLLQEISMYPGVLESQLYRFHPGKEDKIKNLLTHLKKQGRIRQESNGSYYGSGVFQKNADPSMIKALWVLLDFIDRVEFHAAGDFPVKVVFFADGEEYEIIHTPQGQEALVSQAVRLRKDMFSRRIVLVDVPEQISALDFPGISGYCTADPDGRVQYYQKRNGGN